MQSVGSRTSWLILVGLVPLSVASGFFAFVLLDEIALRERFERTVEQPYLASQKSLEQLEDLIRFAEYWEYGPSRVDSEQAEREDLEASRNGGEDFLERFVDSMSDEPGNSDDSGEVAADGGERGGTPPTSEEDRPGTSNLLAAIELTKNDLLHQDNKVDRYRAYLQRSSFVQTSRLPNLSNLSLIILLLLSLGVGGGALGAIMRVTVGRFFEREVAIGELVSVGLQPGFGALVSVMTGYGLIYLSSGIFLLNNEQSLFVPVTVFGVAFLMSLNPYNSARSMYEFFRSQVSMLASSEIRESVEIPSDHPGPKTVVRDPEKGKQR